VRPMDSGSPRVRLAEAICLFRDSVRPSTRVDLIEAAVQAIVDGLDSPSLAELAGRYPADAALELLEASDAVVRELGLFVPPTDQVEAVKVRRKVEALIDGVITARELAFWAHSEVGHEGMAAAQAFVDADDEYDTIEYSKLTVADLDAQVRDQARAYLADTANDPWAEARSATG
jgi:hypothetical protein